MLSRANGLCDKLDAALTRLARADLSALPVEDNDRASAAHRALRVGVDVVRELYGVMAARGATGGFVVTSGRFTDDAIRFASGRNVTLVDGPKLVGLMRQASGGAGFTR